MVVRGMGTLAGAGPEQATFLANPKYRSQLQDTRAGVVILSAADADTYPGTSIITPDPYGYFARLTSLLSPPVQWSSGIDPTASIAADAQVNGTACIGPFVRVGYRAQIGAGTVVEAGVVIGDGVSVGSGCHVHANVVIYHHCHLGDRVILHAGVVIGADGFGYAPSAEKWLKIPQVGGVVIGDDVEVGANTTIDRGALDDTVIEEGVKLDNQIQIAHNVRIGAHTAIAACTGIAGSVRIGKGCRIGGAAMINGHIEICDGVTISGGTLVAKSIRAPGTVTAVFPHMPHDRWVRTAVHLRNIEALVDRVQALEGALAALQHNANRKN